MPLPVPPAARRLQVNDTDPSKKACVLLVVKVVAVGYVFVLPSLLFMVWHSGTAWRTRVARLLDAAGAWWHPVGLFWKLGRTQRSLHDKWPIFFGAPVFVVYRAGQQWTDLHREPDRRAGVDAGPNR
jgi:hypothetical protein